LGSSKKLIIKDNVLKTLSLLCQEGMFDGREREREREREKRKRVLSLFLSLSVFIHVFNLFFCLFRNCFASN